MSVTTQTPHKSLFAGAYLVLDGHPSLTVAIPPRLTLEWSETVELPADNPFAQAAWSVVSEWAVQEGLSLKSGGFVTSVSEETHGWGLGSSAAFTTALTGALLHSALGVEPERELLFALARRAHRVGQGGKGSGADIAACTWGGLVSVEQAQGDETPQVEPLTWPEYLGFVLVRGEQKADTRQLIQRYRDSEEKPSVTALVETIHSLRRVFRDGENVFVPLRQLAMLEEQWSLETGLPLATPLLQKLGKAARVLSQDVVIKSLGGGGGDSIGCFYDRRRVDLANLREFFGMFPVDIRPVDIEATGCRFLASSQPLSQ